MGYRPYTQNGTPLGEVISALQKEIRRGHEQEALYWAMEMLPRYEMYLWRRLLVIANEDIGLGNPDILTQIPELRRQYFEFRRLGKDGTCRLILANAVLLMCRSPKCRMADHLQRVVTQQWVEDSQADALRDVPDYALDKHTRRGRQLGRTGFDFWLDVGCKLEPEADIENPHKEQAHRLWRSGKNDAPHWGKRRKRSSDPEQLNMFEQL
jgi:replication-associated recombination protein RarA